MSSTAYFLLDGAYSEASLYNSPDPVQNMKYPCLISYPFLSDFSHATIDTRPLNTDYENMNASYPVQPCHYCPYYTKRQGT